MFGALISLPVLVLLLSIAYLFVDLSKPKAWILVFCVSISQLGMLATFIYLAILLHQDHNSLLQALSEQQKAIVTSQQDQRLIAARLAIDPENTKSLFKRAMLFGLQENSAYFERMDQADAALQTLLEKRQRIFQQTGISVIRLPENLNQRLVQALFLKLGYQTYYAPPVLEARKDDNALETVTADATTRNDTDGAPTSSHLKPGDEEQDGAPSDDTYGVQMLTLNYEQPLASDQPKVPIEPLPQGNTLFIGQKVTHEDAQIIALVLMRAGMELKNIRRLKPTKDDYDRLALIDYKALYERHPAKTADWVLSRKRFR